MHNPFSQMQMQILEDTRITTKGDRTYIRGLSARIILQGKPSDVLRNSDALVPLLLSFEVKSIGGTMELLENVTVNYSSATNRIALKGKTARIVLNITQEELLKAYSGDEAKATVLITIKEDLNEGVA